MENDKLVVVKEWHIMRLVVMLLLIIGLPLSVFAALTISQLQTKATLSVPSPTPFVEIAPSPRTELTAPYVRLVPQKESVGFLEKLPIDIYLDTLAKEVMELTISLTYDPDLLEITENDIHLENVFKVLSVDKQDPGQLVFTVFINPQSGHKPVVAAVEKKIASLTFKTKALTAEAATVEVVFTPKSTRDTNLVLYTDTRAEKIENSLESVESAQFTIAP